MPDLSAAPTSVENNAISIDWTISHVRATECAHCMYGPNRIVSGSRARQIA